MGVAFGVVGQTELVGLLEGLVPRSLGNSVFSASVETMSMERPLGMVTRGEADHVVVVDEDLERRRRPSSPSGAGVADLDRRRPAPAASMNACTEAGDALLEVATDSATTSPSLRPATRCRTGVVLGALGSALGQAEVEASADEHCQRDEDRDAPLRAALAAPPAGTYSWSSSLSTSARDRAHSSVTSTIFQRLPAHSVVSSAVCRMPPPPGPPACRLAPRRPAALRLGRDRGSGVHHTV